jgi:hypothetical protein
VAFGAYTRVIIETAKSNSEFRGAIRAVYDRRAADTTKPAMKSTGGLKVLDELLPLDPSEIFAADTGSAAKGSAVRLSAV